MRNLKILLCYFSLVLLIPGAAHAVNQPIAYLIVPLPNDIQYQQGELKLSLPFKLELKDGEGSSARISVYSELLNTYIGSDFSKDLESENLEKVEPEEGTPLRLSIDGEVFDGISDSDKLKSEAYQISVSDRGIEIVGATEAGLFYALQTFRQMLRDKNGSKKESLQQAIIIDSPRFPYRGMHLDVGRHFFSVTFVKKYIDLLAMYKFNRFHWHLTEDQGWRIEIKKYPLLTEVGAFREGTEYKGKFLDKPEVVKGRYGGFYTQEEIKEVVAYAQARKITIIPEIELPGHSSAALAAYPQLGCLDKNYKVSQSFGIKEDIYCPKEETFQFLENVLAEVVELFPSEYIHIGGDEAPKTQWQQSEFAQAFIKDNKLKDEDGLQSYFIQRIENFLKTKNRKIIGWDEILEGGLAKDATVMSWRGVQGGIDAAKQKHQVIMSPIQFTYFDLYQGSVTSEPQALGGYVPIDRVYGFEPVPSELSKAESAFILGGQGQVWTEYMKTPEKVEYMVIPRIFALAEVLWTQASNKEWNDFKNRVPNQYRLVAEHQYQAREATLNELPTMEPGLWRKIKGYWNMGINYLPVLYYEVFQKDST